MTCLMTRVESRSMPLWQRERVLRERGLKPVDPQYCIVWEDPHDLDAPARVTIPSPYWLAMAMHGNVLPPVEAYPLSVDDNGMVLPGHRLHDDVIDAMSEEQAMEYLARKDLPEAVWNAPQDNRQRFVICRRTMVPSCRSFRNAWALAA